MYGLLWEEADDGENHDELEGITGCTPIVFVEGKKVGGCGGVGNLVDAWWFGAK